MEDSAIYAEIYDSQLVEDAAATASADCGRDGRGRTGGGIMIGGGPGGRSPCTGARNEQAGNTSATLGRLLRLLRPLLAGADRCCRAGRGRHLRPGDHAGAGRAGVDCYLTPATTSRFTSDSAAARQARSWAARPRWARRAAPRQATAGSPRRRCGTGAIPPNSPAADYIAGLGRLVLVLVVLYVIGSVMTGLQFYLMSWAGQHVLRGLRVERLRAPAPAVAGLLRRERSGRRDEPHHQRHRHDPAGAQLRAGAAWSAASC